MDQITLTGTPRGVWHGGFVPQSGEPATLALLARIRSGDHAAAEELVETTYRGVFGLLARLTGNPDVAADLTQETYRKAWEALPRFDGRAQVSTWLYRIATNTFLNHVRRPVRLVPVGAGTDGSGDDDPPAILERLADGAPSAEDALATAQESALLRKAVLGLQEDLRFTVTAHYWGGSSVNEIAEAEGVTAVAIRKRLKKAMGILAAALGMTGQVTS